MRRDVTTLEVVRGWLKIPATAGTVPVETLTLAYRAAEARVHERTRSLWSAPVTRDPLTGRLVRVWDPDVEPPEDLVLAVCLLTARHLVRRLTPEGLASMGDGIVGRVPGSDADALALMDPWRPISVGGGA